MKASELNDVPVTELHEKLLSLRQQQFKLRMQHRSAQLGQSHLLRQTQRDIARVKTVLTQRSGE